MPENENRDFGCSSCLGCFLVFFSFVGVFFFVYYIWEYATGRKIMWCEETPDGPIAHYSDDHHAKCKACFKDKDSDGTTSWTGEGCVPIVESYGGFVPPDPKSDTDSETGR